MKSEAIFKAVFLTISAIFIVLFVGIFILICALEGGDPDFPKIMIPILLVIPFAVIALMSAITIFVYRDASKNGMNKWMWMTIAVYTPNLVGLIVYIIIRRDNGSRCPQCSQHVEPDYKLCPYCGANLKVKAPVQENYREEVKNEDKI